MKEAVWEGSRAETDPGARLRGKAVLEKGCGKTLRQEGEGWTSEGGEDSRLSSQQGLKWTKEGDSPLPGFFAERGRF